MCLRCYDATMIEANFSRASKRASEAERDGESGPGVSCVRARKRGGCERGPPSSNRHCP